MLIPRLGLAVMLSLCSAGMALAQAPPFEMAPDEPHRAMKAGKIYYAHRVTGESPDVDGRLDDEAWQAAPSIEDHVQIEPVNLAKPTERTVVKVAFDDRYLYMAVYAYTRDSSTIRSGLGRRGNIPTSSDLFTVGIDPQHDHRNGYNFQTNPAGVQNDFATIDDSRLDNTFEAVWEVATSITAEGWFAEIRIPFSQLRFAVQSGQRAVFGMNWRRQVSHSGEWIDWIPLARGTQGLASPLAHVVLDDRLSTPRRIELLPFALTKHEARTGAPGETAASVGLDARIGLGTSATLSATVNPDFGQVEADPAVLNLTVFETFFQERRPFFTEDAGAFSNSTHTGLTDFYSRRIGQLPGRFLLRPGDRLVSRPDETTIVGAARVSGRKLAWNFGGLTALTSEEYAVVDAVVDGSAQRVKRLIEPRTLYNVGRLQRTVGAASQVAVLGTAVVREGDLDAYTVAGDSNIRWSRNRYNLINHWAGTRAPIGSRAAGGFGGESTFQYIGKYLGYLAHYDHFGSDFRNSDLGFFTQRPNKNEARARLTLSQPDPRGMLRNTFSQIEVTRQWNSEGLTFGNSLFLIQSLNFRNFSGFSVLYTRDFERQDDLDTRGGPPIVRPADHFLTVQYFSDSRKRWGYSLAATGFADAAGGDSIRFTPSFRVQPSPRLQASVNAEFTSAHDVAQWIRNTDADGDGIVDHVYGRLHRNVFSLTTRGTFAFTRDMTLEAFLQPFAAVGDYSDIRKLARPNSFDFAPVALADHPDFNRKSLRGTIVLRWEYVRGSTLYAVWNLANQDNTRPGVFSPWRDLVGGFGAPGTSVFALKVSYWFAP